MGSYDVPDSKTALTNNDSCSNLRTWPAIDLIGFFEKGTRRHLMSRAQIEQFTACPLALVVYHISVSFI